MGIAYEKLGETHKAIEYYEQALKIAREIGDRRGEGANLCNLGSAYYHMGETSEARITTSRRLEIVRGDRRSHGEGNALWGQAICYEETNNLGSCHQKCRRGIEDL